MLKQLILENWKSFRYAELNFDPLTVLIGTNASGKSNAIEALEFLNRIFQGMPIQAALTGDLNMAPIRGGADWAAFKSETKFTLKALVQGKDENTDYLYSLTVEVIPKVQLFSESLTLLRRQLESEKSSRETELFCAHNVEQDESSVYIKLPNDDSALVVVNRASSNLYFLSNLAPSSDDETFKCIEVVLESLQGVFVLNPTPFRMRSYSPLSNELLNDASNIAGVLAALPNQKKAEIEATLAEYVAHLPERDIQRVWAETVGRLNSDAMLYCEEAWVTDEEPMLIDARGMSDGTLRFLAILTALLTRAEGSQLVIEDVDDGLHPSRIQLLLKMLREIGAKRNIDILITTHNPALLNALDPEMIPFIAVAYRDSQTGESKLTLLEELESLPQVLALGPLGNAATKGVVERNLATQK